METMRFSAALLGLCCAVDPTGTPSARERGRPRRSEAPPEGWADPFPPGTPLSPRSDGGLTHVVVAADEGHWPGAVGVVNSSLASSAAPGSLLFHVIVAQGAERRAEAFFACRGLSALQRPLRFLGFNSSWVGAARIIRHHRKDLGSPLNYARFFLPALLPTARLAAVLDADVVVRGDLAELLRPARGGGKGFIVRAVAKARTYGKVYDRHITRMVFSKRYRFRLNRSAPTFNAGVLVIDLAAWEARGLTREALWWMDKHRRSPLGLWEYGSQPLMHMVCHMRWQALPRAWNVDGLGWDVAINESVLDGARALHWTGASKPWQPGALYRERWLRYSGLPDCRGSVGPGLGGHGSGLGGGGDAAGA